MAIESIVKAQLSERVVHGLRIMDVVERHHVDGYGFGKLMGCPLVIPIYA